jgi:Tol biopolymer transport system component
MAGGTFEDLNHDFHAFAPTWDPANAWHVVYQATHGLMALDLTQNTTWNIGTDTADRAPVFSPDGSKLADSYWQTSNWEIHVLNADGSGAVRLTQTSDTVLVEQLLQGQTPHSWNNAAPAWSPDGSQIAFISDRTGSWQIWIMNADGSNQHPLFPNGLPNGITIDYGGLSERVLSWR